MNQRPSARTTVHLHGGPHAGVSLMLHEPLPAALMRTSIWLRLPAPRNRSYVQDATSAGGRCYDWVAE